MQRKAWPVVVVTAALLLGACASDEDSTPSPTEAEQSEFNGATSLSFLQLNDLHANLVGHWEAVRQPGSEKVRMAKRGGIARTASKIKQLRSEYPEGTILMNIGDTFHGGAEAMFSNGNAIVAPVNALGIDVGVPGNWDYAYGPVVTNARFGGLQHEGVLRPNYPNLAANATYKIPDTLQASPLFMQNMMQSSFAYTAGEPFLPASMMLQRQGLNIGVIGLTSDIVERMHKMMAFNLEFTEGRDAYLQLLQNEAAKLQQQQADMIVVISELGIHKDWALAKALPAGLVQVFFSGHTHEATETAQITDHGTYVVEAGNDTMLGQLVVDFNDQRAISAMHWTLHAITDDLAEDTEMAALVSTARAPFLADSPNLSIETITLPDMPPALSSMMPQMFTQTLDHGLDTTLGSVSLPLTRRQALMNEFNNLYTDWLRHDSGADVALSPGFRFDSAVIPAEHNHSGDAAHYYWEVENNAVLNGEVTVADVYRFFPAPYHLAQGEISAADLKGIIESNLSAVFSPDVFKQNGGWVDGFSGIKLSLDLSQADGSRILSMTREDDSDIPDNEMLQVAGCARPMDMNAASTLCSYEGFSNVNPLAHPQKAGETWPAADLMIQAVSEDWINLYNLGHREAISDRSNTAQWPDSQFYQPLEGVSP